MQTPLKFRNLAIGDTFCFDSERTLPYSGMARGPWVKTGARFYKHQDDELCRTRNWGRIRVGSINTGVFRTETKENV